MKHLQILTLISNSIKKMNSRIPQMILWFGTGFLMLELVIGCSGGAYYHRLASSPSYSRNMTHTLISEEPAQDQYAVINENEYQDPKVSPLSTFSIDVDTASYSNLRRFLKNGQRPPVDAVRIEEMINYFTYDYQAPQSTNEHPFSVYTELAQAPWNPQHQLLHIGLQGKKIPQTDLPPNNLVFLLDVSGSMHGRLPLLKNALRLLSGTLRAQDKVSIVVYAGAAGLVLPPTSGD